MTTIGIALQAAAVRLGDAGIDDARLEAEVLCAYALGVDRAQLLARLGDKLSADRTAIVESLIARRMRREPLAYITGTREFYGFALLCAPGALIPRPETEFIVALALEELRLREDALRIADVGTGSGAVAVAIAVNAPNTRIIAVDSSHRALSLARRNVDAHGVGDRVELREGDMLDGLGELDLIVANLPYVSEGDWQTLEAEVRDWEPREALVAGPMGVELNSRLVEAARSQLSPGGLLIAEMGESHGAALLKLAQISFPRGEVCVKKDFAGHDRLLTLRVAGSSEHR